MITFTLRSSDYRAVVDWLLDNNVQKAWRLFSGHRNKFMQKDFGEHDVVIEVFDVTIPEEDLALQFKLALNDRIIETFKVPPLPND